ncbi:MAG: hypothetical protein AAGD25_18075 [Cyanobacteria bacterium P01_F01_bin.150]
MKVVIYEISLSLLFLGMSILMIAGVMFSLSDPYPKRQEESTETILAEDPVDFSQPAWGVTVPNIKVRSLPSQPPQRHPLAPNLYKQFMDIGYAAYQKQDYQTALINFRRALEEQENDRYAEEAIANTETIIQRQRQRSSNE